MNAIFKKIFSKKLFSNFLVFTLLSFGLSAYSDDLFIPLLDKVDRAKLEFNDLYKYFLDQNPEEFKASNENFKLKSNITGHILENGPVLLNLISLLNKNKKNDSIGLLLLRKLNRYLYLEFRHFVGLLNVNKKYEGRLIGLLHDFYKFKVPAQVGSIEESLKYEYPFQATISKAMIFILIINASSLNYDEKVENVAYFLDKIRRELLEIKKCYDNCNLRIADVNDFVELLQTYAAKEPILGPNYLKRIFIAVIIVAAIILVVWLAWNKVLRGQIENKIGEGWEVVSDKLKKLIKSFGGLFVEGALEHVDSDKVQAGIRKSVGTALNTVYESGARVVPGCPIVPMRIDISDKVSDDRAHTSAPEPRTDPDAAVGPGEAEAPVGRNWLSWFGW